MEPKEEMLFRIPYTDSGGKEQCFCLIEEIQTKCKKLGTILGIGQSILDGFEERHRGNMENFCKTVLHTWMTRENKNYPVTWNGLLEALRHAQLGGIATRLEDTLELFYQ